MSLRTDPTEAAAEALEEALDPMTDQSVGLVFLFATSHHSAAFPDILKFIRARTSPRALLGATGAGVIGPRGESELKPALSILAVSAEGVTTSATILPRLDEEDVVDELRGEMPSLFRERGVLIALAEPRSLHPDFLTRLSLSCSEIPVIGAAAGWCTADQRAIIAADGDVAHSGAAVLHLAGCVEPVIGVAQAVMPDGVPKPVTKAIGNVIYEIDHNPASELLTAFVQIQKVQSESGIDAFCALASSPLDFSAGRYVVRQILALDPVKRSLTVSDNILVGQYLCFGIRTPKGSRRSFRQMLERQSATLTNRVPRAAVLFNCCARGQSLYGRPHVDLDAFREFFPDLPVTGLFGFAEIGPVHWERKKVRSAVLNHTAVLALLTEPMEAINAP